MDTLILDTTVVIITLAYLNIILYTFLFLQDCHALVFKDLFVFRSCHDM